MTHAGTPGTAGSAAYIRGPDGKIYRQGDTISYNEQYDTGQNSGGFGEDFFNRFRQGMLDTYMPQVEKQYGEAKDDLTYGLARAGTGRSSAAVDATADLAEENRINRANIGTEADRGRRPAYRVSATSAEPGTTPSARTGCRRNRAGGGQNIVATPIPPLGDVFERRWSAQTPDQLPRRLKQEYGISSPRSGSNSGKGATRVVRSLTLGTLAVGAAGTAANSIGQAKAAKKQEAEYSSWAATQEKNRASENIRQEGLRKEAQAAQQQGVADLSAENQKRVQEEEAARLTALTSEETMQPTASPSAPRHRRLALTTREAAADVQTDLAKASPSHGQRQAAHRRDGDGQLLRRRHLRQPRHRQPTGARRGGARHRRGKREAARLALRLRRRAGGRSEPDRYSTIADVASSSRAGMQALATMRRGMGDWRKPSTSSAARSSQKSRRSRIRWFRLTSSLPSERTRHWRKSVSKYAGLKQAPTWRPRSPTR
jgi:hypothetical protein